MSKMIIRLKLIVVLVACVSGCSALSPTKFIDIGLTKHAYYISEEASPAIVFQSGLGDGKDVWAKVVPNVKGNMVFAYDRLGYGQSAPAGNESDSCSIARDLHEMLRAVHVSPPYILVGHSIGGLYQYTFAKMYPNEVSGLVLLDPTHPNHWKEMQKKAPIAAAMVTTLKSTVFNEAARREFDQQEICLESEGIFSPESIKIPAILMFSTEFKPSEKGDFESMVKELRADWEKMIPNAQVINVNSSGHYIQRDKPKDVVEGIRILSSKLNTANKSVNSQP